MPGDLLKVRIRERIMESFVEGGPGDQPSPTTLLVRQAVAEVSSPASILNLSLSTSLADIGVLRAKAFSLRDACQALYAKLQGSSAFLRVSPTPLLPSWGHWE